MIDKAYCIDADNKITKDKLRDIANTATEERERIKQERVEILQDEELNIAREIVQRVYSELEDDAKQGKSVKTVFHYSTQTYMEKFNQPEFGITINDIVTAAQIIFNTFKNDGYNVTDYKRKGNHIIEIHW